MNLIKLVLLAMEVAQIRPIKSEVIVLLVMKVALPALVLQLKNVFLILPRLFVAQDIIPLQIHLMIIQIIHALIHVLKVLL